MDKNLIIGIYSIQLALQNSRRRDFEIFMTKEGHKTLASSLHGRNDIKQASLKSYDFQEKAKQIYRQLNFEYQRIPGGAMLLCSALEVKTPDYLYRVCESQEKLKIVVLDGVTDIHNAGAIMRTASFYGTHIVVVGGKFSFGMSPGFFKMASGAVEHLSVVQALNLPRAIRKIQELGVQVFALSEHGEGELTKMNLPKVGIVLGAEDRGISHALLRQCEKKLVIKSLGQIPSLNVSVASAIAMERLFTPPTGQ